MLVLTRKPGQSIMIGDGIEVQVLSVAGEKVRLGITAPRDVTIFRDEVLERIQDQEAREHRRHVDEPRAAPARDQRRPAASSGSHQAAAHPRSR